MIIGLIIIIIVLCVFSIIKFSSPEEKEYFIPKVYFEGDISDMVSKQDVRKILLKYESDSINFETYASIKIQGTSSIFMIKRIII